MTALADFAVELGWHGWQASLAGLVALAVAAFAGNRAPRAAALVLSLALLKFIVPPLVRVPIAFGDTAAMLVNPFAMLPSGQEADGIALALLATLGAVMMAVSGVMAVRVLAHLRAVSRVRRNAVPAGGRAPEALARVARRLGLRIAPVLLVSDEADGPFATGVWRPAVVLPRALAAQLDDAGLDAVLAHELLHHRRRDLPMAWCAAAATTVFWFSPVAWRLARRLTELREHCCDAGVVSAGFATPRAYAETLIAAASMPSGLGALPMRDAHPLGRRLRRVLESPAPLPYAAAAAIVALFALLCLPATPFASPWHRDGDRLIRVERIVR